MDINGLKKFIEKTIESYLESNVNIGALLNDSFYNKVEENKIIETEEDILAHLDAKSMSNSIVESMKNKILDYELSIGRVSNFDGNGSQEYCCPYCYRPFGGWRSESGHFIEEPTVLKQGTSILLVNDLNG